MKQKKMTVSELLRLACIYAERDQEDYLRAIDKTNDFEEKLNTQAFLRQIRAYRLKRWGKSKLEDLMENAVSTPITEIAVRLGVKEEK